MASPMSGMSSDNENYEALGERITRERDNSLDHDQGHRNGNVDDQNKDQNKDQKCDQKYDSDGAISSNVSDAGCDQEPENTERNLRDRPEITDQDQELENKDNSDNEQKSTKGRMTKSKKQSHTQGRQSNRSTKTLINEGKKTERQSDEVCDICKKILTKDDNVIACDKCNNWTHFECSELPTYMISWLQEKEDREYHCQRCVKIRPKILKIMEKQEKNKQIKEIYQKEELLKRDKQIKEERDKANRQILNQNVQIEQMSDQISRMHREFTELNEYLKQLEGEIRQAEKEKIQLESEKYKIEEDLRQSRDQTNLTRNENKSLKTITKGLEQENKEMITEISKIRMRLKLEAEKNKEIEEVIQEKRRNSTESDRRRLCSSGGMRPVEEAKGVWKMESQERITSPVPKQPCLLFLAGRCPMGDRCLDKHIVQEKMIINPNREEEEAEEENEMTECEVEVKKEHVGMIGKQGNTVKLIQQRTGTRIASPSGGVKFKICGKREQIEQALGMMRNILTEIEAKKEQRTKDIDPGYVVVDVPIELVGYIIGPQASLIKEIMKDTNTYIETPPKGDTEFKVRGDPDSIKAAMREIQLKIAARRNMNNEANERPVRKTVVKFNIMGEPEITEGNVNDIKLIQQIRVSPVRPSGKDPRKPVSPVRPVMRYPPKPTREVKMVPAGEQRRETNYMNEVKDIRFYDEEGNRRNPVLTQATKCGEEETESRIRQMQRQMEKCEQLYKEFGEELKKMKSN